MLRARAVWTGFPGSPYLSTFYSVGDDTQTGADAFITDIAQFLGAVDNILMNSLTWTTDTEVDVMTAAGVVTGNFATTVQTGTGGVAGTLNSLITQGLIRLRTGVFVAGREVRGRLFIPGIPTSSNAGGLLGATAITTLNTAASTFAAETTSGWAVWSRKNSTVAAINSVSTWNQFASLRSRRD